MYFWPKVRLCADLKHFAGNESSANWLPIQGKGGKKSKLKHSVLYFLAYMPSIKTEAKWVVTWISTWNKHMEMYYTFFANPQSPVTIVFLRNKIAHTFYGKLMSLLTNSDPRLVPDSIVLHLLWAVEVSWQ